jgi:hypothetical protein
MQMYARNASRVKQISAQCDTLARIYVKPKDKDSVKDEDCVSCMNQIAVYMPSTGNSYSNAQYLSLEMIKGMLFDDESKDLFLVEQIESQLDLMTTVSGRKMRQMALEDDSCSYDPKENAVMIEELMKLDCVKDIYVPDPWLLNYFSRKKGSEVPFLKGFIEDDEFEIDMSERFICSE